MNVPARRPAVRPLARFALRQYGLVTRSQAVAAGCSDDVLDRLCRDGSLHRVERGVYRLSGVPSSFEQRVFGACLARGGVACRSTALRLYDFEPGADGPIEILCRGNRRPAPGGQYLVRTTQALLDCEVVTRKGIPVTGPARTLRDVAGHVPALTLDRLLGHLLASRELSVAEVSALAAAPAGERHRGQRMLREAVERAGIMTAPDSVLEHRALLLLRAAGLPEPLSHLPVHSRGRLIGEVDFAWPDERVILEVDGYRWHADPQTFAEDRRRDNSLRDLGWSVYRTTFAELAAGAPELIRQLRRALAG
jgi:hypothetical protein